MDIKGIKEMKTTKEMIEVMTAYDSGAEIERFYTGKWEDIKVPCWDWDNIDYRIKEQKKTVTIEKWLVKDNKRAWTHETSSIDSYLTDVAAIKVKLLKTYEIEL